MKNLTSLKIGAFKNKIKPIEFKTKTWQKRIKEVANLYDIKVDSTKGGLSYYENDKITVANKYKIKKCEINGHINFK